MSKNETLRMALEALEFEANGWEDVPPVTSKAITALRQAIEQAEKQEHIINCPRCGHCCPGTAEQAQPVAWRTEVKHGRLYFHIGVQSFPIDYQPEDEQEWSAGDSMAWMEKRLHEALSNLAPPPSQPLSDGEIYTAYITATNQTLRAQDERLAFAFARAVEAAHGIKGEE
jgi:hypothetical protein